jgi:UDP-N-acetylglucosamine acyltransferase
MAYVHIGHDSLVGNDTILVNNTALAGHVEVGDWAILSGYTLVHQFCKIGAHSFSGMGTSIGKDVPAYVTVAGSPAEAKTINVEGLRRRGFDSTEIAALRRAFKILYRQSLTLDAAVERLQAMTTETPSLQPLIDSLMQSQRGIVR